MDVSGKGRYRQGLDALASSGGSMTGAWLAVLWCPTLGIPVISGLALLTSGAFCVVLAALWGGRGVERGLRLSPWRPQIPGVGKKEGGTHLAGTCFGLTDLCVAMAAATFAGAQVEAAGHACIACVTVLGAGR